MYIKILKDNKTSLLKAKYPCIFQSILDRSLAYSLAGFESHFLLDSYCVFWCFIKIFASVSSDTWTNARVYAFRFTCSFCAPGCIMVPFSLSYFLPICFWKWVFLQFMDHTIDITVHDWSHCNQYPTLVRCIDNGGGFACVETGGL